MSGNSLRIISSPVLASRITRFLEPLVANNFSSLYSIPPALKLRSSDPLAISVVQIILFSLREKAETWPLLSTL